jgi:quercetin dioxygenase-like cupin family protein
MTDSGISSSGSREGVYQVESRITLAEVADLRVRQLCLAAGQYVPWHYHSNITDTFFCMKGPMSVKTREPEFEFILTAGETVAIPPGRPHYAAGVDLQACQFMIVQGVGTYDYVPLDD